MSLNCFMDALGLACKIQVGRTNNNPRMFGKGFMQLNKVLSIYGQNGSVMCFSKLQYILICRLLVSCTYLLNRQNIMVQSPKFFNNG